MRSAKSADRRSGGSPVHPDVVGRTSVFDRQMVWKGVVVSFLSTILGDNPEEQAARETNKKRELDFAYEQFEWNAEPLLWMGKLDEVKDLFVKYAVDSQMKNPGDEGNILLEYDEIVKRLVRKPRESIRRGWFDDI